jgi:hypothetical protein
MIGYEYKDGISTEECKNGAYWERNMLALRFADGWYYDSENNWDGHSTKEKWDRIAERFNIKIEWAE